MVTDASEADEKELEMRCEQLAAFFLDPASQAMPSEQLMATVKNAKLKRSKGGGKGGKGARPVRKCYECDADDHIALNCGRRGWPLAGPRDSTTQWGRTAPKVRARMPRREKATRVRASRSASERTVEIMVGPGSPRALNSKACTVVSRIRRNASMRILGVLRTRAHSRLPRC